MLTDDLIKENDVTVEALRRLPAEVYQERQYRLARAIQYSANKSVLSKDEWTIAEQVRPLPKPIIKNLILIKINFILRMLAT